MWYTHKNEGDGQYIEKRQVKKYQHPSGTLYFEILKISIFGYFGQNMNSRGKNRNGDDENTKSYSDPKYISLNTIVLGAQNKKLAL